MVLKIFSTLSVTYNIHLPYFVSKCLLIREILLPLQSQTATGSLETLENANFSEKKQIPRNSLVSWYILLAVPFSKN